MLTFFFLLSTSFLCIAFHPLWGCWFSVYHHILPQLEDLYNYFIVSEVQQAFLFFWSRWFACPIRGGVCTSSLPLLWTQASLHHCIYIATSLYLCISISLNISLYLSIYDWWWIVDIKIHKLWLTNWPSAFLSPEYFGIRGLWSRVMRGKMGLG